MTEHDMEIRLNRLKAAADAERRLIESEREAEATLKRAEERLAKIESDFLELEKQVNERRRAVKDARVFLTAVQRQRAEGPASSD